MKFLLVVLAVRALIQALASKGSVKKKDAEKEKTSRAQHPAAFELR